MCGIFGMILGEECGLNVDGARKAIDKLFLLSESRGKEAAGLALIAGETVQVFKQPLPAAKLIKLPEYKKLWASCGKGEIRPPLAVIGHSRLVTNGLQGISANNQPVVKDGIVGIHNGIIVNDAALWQANPEITRISEVDTEVFLSLLRLYLKRGYGLKKALSTTYSEIEGAASVALFFEDLPVVVLATNTGSLYTASSESGKTHFFASEQYILQEFFSKTRIENEVGKCNISHLKPGSALIIDLKTSNVMPFRFDRPSDQLETKSSIDGAPGVVKYRLLDLSSNDEERRRRLRRCTRCILPETFPMISFDEQGVCNVCREYKRIELKGEEALRELAEKVRRNDGTPDCVVAFSGGRDSSYMLHYVKRELGLNPVAYSYDWGMITDLARRNQARLTGKLGVEHIIVSADIKEKRKNIRRNVLAWLKRPSLGMIPLFMAGDKQYFYYLEQLRRRFGVELAFLGGNPLEKTGFKTGFAGVRENASGRTYDISSFRKLQIALYYAGQFLTNPAYLNKSLFDTLHAFYSSYIMKHNFVWLYRYIPWDEKKIDEVLHKEYNWEVATDTDTTWRIGDGTAAFYNYIYYTVAGFSENDALRSNQVREGMITREEALKLAERDNQPRYASMREYAYLVGFDLDEALYVINAMPKLY